MVYKKLISLPVLSLFLLTACGQANLSFDPASEVKTSEFSPFIIQRLDRPEISDLPVLYDLNTVGDTLYFINQEGSRLELKKRNLETRKEEIVSIFEEENKILKFSMAANEGQMAFMVREGDEYVLYTNELYGGSSTLLANHPAIKSNPLGTQINPGSMTLKRVGLESKFLFSYSGPPECGGQIWDKMSHDTLSGCDYTVKILSHDEMIQVEYLSENKSKLTKGNYLYGGEETILEIPVGRNEIEALYLLDEKTVRVVTPKEYLDVKLQE